MGTVAALLYLSNFSKTHKVKGLVLDSPLADMEDVISIYCQKNISLPDIVSDIGFNILNMGIKSRAGIDLKEIKPINVVS